MACVWNFARLFWGAYLHNYVSEFMKKKTFSRSVESWHAYPYSTCRQVEISFLGMPQIAHFQVEKWKKLPSVGGGTPPSHTLPPLGRYTPSGLVASLPRKDCAPPQKKIFWLITPLLVQMIETNKR